MFNWLKNLYVVKLLFGTPEEPKKVAPMLPISDKKKTVRKPGRPGIKTRKTKTVKK
jgi:hypothetical protein